MNKETLEQMLNESYEGEKQTWKEAITENWNPDIIYEFLREKDINLDFAYIEREYDAWLEARTYIKLFVEKRNGIDYYEQGYYSFDSDAYLPQDDWNELVDALLDYINRAEFINEKMK